MSDPSYGRPPLFFSETFKYPVIHVPPMRYYCSCGHAKEDHTYTIEPYGHRLECDICGCKQYEGRFINGIHDRGQCAPLESTETDGEVNNNDDSG